MDATLLDTAGTVVATLLTLMVFSYLLGDNILYRLAEHLFVGVSIGYVVVIVFHQILAARLLTPLADALVGARWTQAILLAIPLALGLMLLTKPLKRLSWLGSVSIAVLLGVGGALAIGGALVGTLLPQIESTADITQYVARYGAGLGLFSGLIMLAGTTGVLVQFHYGAGKEGRLAGLRQTIVRTWGGFGRLFLLIAFGAILAATFVSRLSLLAGRVEFLIDSVRGLFGG